MITDPSVEHARWSELLSKSARGASDELGAYLHDVGDAEMINGTRISVRAHWVPLDAHGRPRMQPLANRLVEELVNYCIPRTRIDEAFQHYASTGSSSKVVRLNAEARELFTSQANSGEGGELLLYALLELSLGIPQVLCKMPLKTNSEMHIHGVDGIHAGVTEMGDLAVYWGEAKVWSDFRSAMNACFSSVAVFLTDDGSGGLLRDMTLARDNLDALHPHLTESLIKYFDNDFVESQKLEMRAACLIGFGQADYSDPFDATGAVLAEIDEMVAEWRGAISKRVTALGIDAFEMEVFCVPFPTADAFRKAIQDALRS